MQTERDSTWTSPWLQGDSKVPWQLFQTEACLFVSLMWVPREKKATEVVACDSSLMIFIWSCPFDWHICRAGNGSLWKCVNDDYCHWLLPRPKDNKGPSVHKCTSKTWRRQLNSPSFIHLSFPGSYLSHQLKHIQRIKPAHITPHWHYK